MTVCRTCRGPLNRKGLECERCHMSRNARLMSQRDDEEHDEWQARRVATIEHENAARKLRPPRKP